MERITIKFYRVIRFTDPSGEFKVKLELGLIGTQLMGKITNECEGFPITTTIIGPFEPKVIEKMQNDLREEEKKGEINNLKFDEEITCVGIRIQITSEQVQMN